MDHFFLHCPDIFSSTATYLVSLAHAEKATHISQYGDKDLREPLLSNNMAPLNSRCETEKKITLEGVVMY